MRKVVLLLLITVLVGCVTYIDQKPLTTLLPPSEPDLKKYYDDNIEGILCLAEHISPQRMLIGVGYEPSSDGLKIKTILEGSPAQIAGLKVGDILTKVNGKPVTYPLKIDSPADIEIRRESSFITVRIVPALFKSNNAVETKISIEEKRGEKYIVETIVSGVELNTVQFKSTYERSKWMISNWAIVFWKYNNVCLQEKVKSENIAMRFLYRHRNFVTERYQRRQDEYLEIYSKRSDILSYIKGDISVQDLLDKSMIFINGSREKLLMQ